jgi:hypothetical protein
LAIRRLPGSEGGLRKPYLMPSDGILKDFADRLLRLGIPQIDDMAQRCRAQWAVTVDAPCSD